MSLVIKIGRLIFKISCSQVRRQMDARTNEQTVENTMSVFCLPVWPGTGIKSIKAIKIGVLTMVKL